MNPITSKQAPVERTSGGYTATAMRAIRALQEQLQELGKRLQDEITKPTASGPEQDQLMRDLAQQMNSVRLELDALQESIIQHEALAAFKKEQASERLNPQPAQQAPGPLPSGLSKPATADEANQGKGANRPRADKMSVVGSVINTTA